MKEVENDVRRETSSKTLALKVSVCGKSNLNEVAIKLQDVRVKCVVDSGADITVLHQSLLPGCFKEPAGKIRLKGAFGQVIEADILTLPMTLDDPEMKDERNQVQINALITVAVTPLLDAGLECLLTPGDYDLLCRKQDEGRLMKLEINDEGYSENSNSDVVISNEASVSAGEIISEEEIVIAMIKENKPEIKDNKPEIKKNEQRNKQDETVEQKRNIMQLLEEQSSDESLKICHREAKKEGSAFYYRSVDNLLYHTGQVTGRMVQQLVLPKSHRAEVMKLGHDIEWSGHLAGEKTYQRIAVSFFWPEMKKEIMEYCRSCESCQLRRKKTCWDRIPINPVVRPPHAFEIMNFDIVGPFMNKSSGYAYVLTCIDQCSRWPEAVPLRNVTAKSIVETLLWIFTRTGIPRIVVADNASYNTSELTREFLRRIGITPRFSTPYHPEGNSLIERYQAVIKAMIHHAVHSGKDWHHLIPYGLWAYREIPNATTGVSPHKMVYGRPARGVLAALKETWTGEQVFSIHSG